MTENHQQNEPGKGLGKGMWVATWICGLILLTLMFGEQEKRWINPNQNPASSTNESGVQQVRLKRNRQGHYVASGAINGHKTQFMLDTGATDVAISEGLANRFGLTKGRAGQAMTANGLVTVYATRIARLQIGEIILYDVPASISPAMDDFILLGMSALQRVDFSQQGEYLTLSKLPNS